MASKKLYKFKQFLLFFFSKCYTGNFCSFFLEFGINIKIIENSPSYRISKPKSVILKNSEKTLLFKLTSCMIIQRTVWFFQCNLTIKILWFLCLVMPNNRMKNVIWRKYFFDKIFFSFSANWIMFYRKWKGPSFR